MKLKFYFLLTLLFISKMALADDSFEAINAISNKYGISVSQVSKNDIEININENAALAAVPLMKEEGLYNPDVSQSLINMTPITTASTVGFFMSSPIVMSIYKNTNLDAITIKEYLLTTNDYGNENKHLILSFNFTRALNDKINWNNMDSTKLLKIALHPKLTEWYSEQLANESL